MSLERLPIEGGIFPVNAFKPRSLQEIAIENFVPDVQQQGCRQNTCFSPQENSKTLTETPAAQETLSTQG